ncbi:5-formyltetrahydrofolate cyclo-ligase [Crocosphaera sp. UHCC 0190]|uniref:5-formyltetrahydrofolate cyclo-ligase n=1 Tax=Crocosphaera sp. UHCC 0190 TaxID=3110246 RepID=UPI002B2145E5|nr:5-formyltetrahydrofolate cyclo-ligase [Crocosphaera sp. UHCC 0190]MEA5510028.1 5-formyltetrahydrofolate cyclo-ligase [Crocosphaera sp. UHCC 0190]
MNSKTSKKRLRKKIIEQRKNLSESVWKETSDRLCQTLQSSLLFQQGKTILAYFPIHREPDITPLFNSNHHWGFSRCLDNHLVWHSWTPQDPLITGKYGILEPAPTAPILTAAEVDLILIPAVACDYQGYRLGYGGGFYDRLLSSPQWHSIPTMGIIFEFALLSQLPVDSWDQKLTAICTETKLLSIYA